MAARNIKRSYLVFNKHWAVVSLSPNDNRWGPRIPSDEPILL